MNLRSRTRLTRALLLAALAGAALCTTYTVEAAAPESQATRSDDPADRPVGGRGEAPQEDDPVGGRTKPGFGPWLQTLVALAIVVVAIFATRLLVRRLARRSGPGGSGAVLDVLARMPISGREELLVVRLGRRVVLLGRGREGLTTLSEVSDADEAASLLEAVGRPAQGRARSEKRS